jgi:hypothetical protein
MVSELRDACATFDAALAKVEIRERDAAPHTARIHAAERTLSEAEHNANMAMIRDRLDRMPLEPHRPTMERDLGIEPPGLGR